jgi:cation diffusion facilitator CzcD-associated flavoprotein CzcO
MAEPITAIIIGAGPAGIAMGYHLKAKLGTNDFAIFDQNPEAGGTWYSNSYPGCGIFHLRFYQLPKLTVSRL